MNNSEVSDQIFNEKDPERQGFWKGQFAPTRTSPQLVFDVLFGLLAPVLCFYFDPIVFQGGMLGEPLFSSYQVFAYSVTAIEVTVLLLWLLGRRLGSVSALLAGFLIAGSVFSAVIGFAILPFSLLGLMMVIGIFGFTPFLTAFVYLRNGGRALRADVYYPVTRSWLPLMMMGFILALGVPAFFAIQVSQSVSNSVDAILYDDAVHAEAAVHRLQAFPFVTRESLNPIVNSYMGESNEIRKNRLKKSYYDLTGEDLETRARILAD